MSDQGPGQPEENPYASPSGPEPPPAYQPYQPEPPQQPIYGPPQPGMYAAPAAPSAPDHPQANTAFILGLVSLVGGFFCGLPIFVGPFAWVMGARARREIDQAPYRYGGRERATAGMIMGIVATALAALVLLVIGIAILVIALSASS